MAKQNMIFVNLPVKDLNRSMEFFKQLGYSFNPQFTNEQGACLVISDVIFIMLVENNFYQTFTKKTIADATKTSEVMVALNADSKEEVNEWLAKAVAAGATTPNAPIDLGFMYSVSFDDLDGHHWEMVHMDMSKVPPAP
ncbi:VOC family protein [Chitinophaga sp. 22620]|uniref:VOC family protein n=1 Tax=Chitinophaga sp. 22620 TaxID=3453952 RepID=UPI003F844F2A